MLITLASSLKRLINGSANTKNAAPATVIKPQKIATVSHALFSARPGFLAPRFCPTSVDAAPPMAHPTIMTRRLILSPIPKAATARVP